MSSRRETSPLLLHTPQFAVCHGPVTRLFLTSHCSRILVNGAPRILSLYSGGSFECPSNLNMRSHLLNQPLKLSLCLGRSIQANLPPWFCLPISTYGLKERPAWSPTPSFFDRAISLFVYDVKEGSNNIANSIFCLPLSLCVNPRSAKFLWSFVALPFQLPWPHQHLQSILHLILAASVCYLNYFIPKLSSCPGFMYTYIYICYSTSICAK